MNQMKLQEMYKNLQESRENMDFANLDKGDISMASWHDGMALASLRILECIENRKHADPAEVLAEVAQDCLYRAKYNMERMKVYEVK